METRLAKLSPAKVRITIVTPYEQLRQTLGLINSAQTVERVLAPYEFLLLLLDYYATQWQGRILGFDQAAANVYRSFDQKLIRKIGACDAKIAAIALANGPAVLTANRRDFELVPGLIVEEWPSDPAP